MKRVSCDIINSKVQLIDKVDSINIAFLIPGVYIACIYDSLSYIGIIIEQSIENCDVKVKFMKKVNQNIFIWPRIFSILIVNQYYTILMYCFYQNS